MLDRVQLQIASSGMPRGYLFKGSGQDEIVGAVIGGEAVFALRLRGG